MLTLEQVEQVFLYLSLKRINFIMKNKTIQNTWGLKEKDPVPPVPLGSLWQWADVPVENTSEIKTLAVEQDVEQVNVLSYPYPGMADEDFIPWEDLPDPLEPHGTCSGLNCWWDLTGRQRCVDCDPPNKARLLRSTVATQRRRAERRRQAAQRTEVAP